MVCLSGVPLAPRTCGSSDRQCKNLQKVPTAPRATSKLPLVLTKNQACGHRWWCLHGYAEPFEAKASEDVTPTVMVVVRITVLATRYKKKGNHASGTTC
jgi:hypothetical protein